MTDLIIANPRVIMHLDMNSFFASVEQAANPELKGIPLAVAGNPKERRGILVTCSYEARAFGVYTTMTVGEAKRLCPKLTIVPPRHELYRQMSDSVFDILRSYTEWVEPVSIDEAYIDTTDIGGLTRAYDLAREIQLRILAELDLPCSIGIAPNKFLAKTASDMKKPMGITILRKREVPKMLWPLPVIEMHGIGKRTEEKLHSADIKTMGDLATAEKITLEALLGKNGLRLKQRANGIDTRPVDPESADERKSIGSSTTLPVDLTELEDCVPIFERLAKKVAARLETKLLAGMTISIQIRYADWQNTTRSRTLQQAVYLEKDITDVALQLFQQHWNHEPIRLLGITAANVIERSEMVKQLTFDNFEQQEKEYEMDQLMSSLTQRFGDGIIKKGFTKK
ncbi:MULTISPECIES: DNA polymerase IV [unclassified Sporosarcina]|uniref:DNA polymerase IV n=1 Tax=unclassified Sporosarcina TaxID=2647733 RepID=UPI000C1698F6|nr:MULTISPECIES: DNA polymerase IV [unclassified Sporosarcina]PID00352.1 DNA polymerase IV [Sporosarcina sp. P29]PID06595.1 DNA polymerase IV [Sporosarcina sp. P30]PID09789.1 DNA polymerase IV [Sporosarcina sp. P31]PID13368.1 DNA polymerase IV [Sporosarcina sp. P32b]